MEIRKVTENDDFEAIGDIYAQSWKSAYQGIVAQEYLDALIGGQWASVLCDRKYDSYVVLEDGKYIGTSVVGASRDEKLTGWGELITIYLLPEYFGRGYAEPLIHCAVKALREMGCMNVYLWTLEENTRARRFYEKHGFCENGDSSIIEIAGKKLNEIRYIKNMG